MKENVNKPIFESGFYRWFLLRFLPALGFLLIFFSYLLEYERHPFAPQTELLGWIAIAGWLFSALLLLLFHYRVEGYRRYLGALFYLALFLLTTFGLIENFSKTIFYIIILGAVMFIMLMAAFDSPLRRVIGYPIGFSRNVSCINTPPADRYMEAIEKMKAELFRKSSAKGPNQILILDEESLSRTLERILTRYAVGDTHEKEHFAIAETIVNIEDFLKSRGCNEAEIQMVKKFLEEEGVKLLKAGK